MKQVLKRILPAEVGHAVHRRLRGKGVPYENLYHCCTWKSASQWFVQLFSHPRVMEYSELGVMPVTAWADRFQSAAQVRLERPEDVRQFLRSKMPQEHRYPPRTVATTLYYSRQEFLNLPLPSDYRAFFVMRDPRDLIVSYYFSMRDSHVENPWVLRTREALRGRDEQAGLHFVIDQLARDGFFDILRSWSPDQIGDRRLRVFRYEQLAADQEGFVRELLRWLQIRLPEPGLAEVLRDTAFQALSGRPRGQEDNRSHLRKGVSGDWRSRLGPDHLRRLQDAAPGLVSQLGYEPADRGDAGA